ncbi:Fatty acid synthase apf5 [Colletotrichum sidae]|uniref:beta-ketoacyl-[acyl-carrier-protein] synthase I n=1 Tax=Colletotrichum sidae TaxID=1347389 RepID=A0A4R8T7D9_9PEZI|nr:Fatty acid synthase apf5 [Colletotrichum sidae]
MAVKRDGLSVVDEWQADLEELELFRNEHGDDYINGIKPIFDIRKERVYDSFWKWCTRDVAILFDLAKHPTINNIDLIESISRSTINRATDKSIAQIQHLCSQTNGEKTHHGRIMRLCLQASISFKNRDPAFIDSSPDMGPITSIDKQGRMVYTEKPRTAPFKARRPSIPQVPYAVGSYDHGILTLSDRLSSMYAEDLDNARQSGMSFRGKNFLVTGAGRNSIGFEVLKCLVEGGARCTVTTSSYSPEVTRMYQQLYSRHGGKDSVLRVLPFNQGSRKDIQELAKIMVDGWEPDFIIPFAAISENGRELEDLDSKSELAHRLMLTNLLRLLGTIARNKRQRGIATRPATVVLPLSPNHGLLGNDGLYAESKRGLETLLSKWKSETWRDYLSTLAVVIGWTRSTGLMEDNNIVAQGVEALGVRTFSKEQMAGLIACLLGGRMNAASQSIPLVVDLSGGMGKVNDLKEKLTRVRHELKAEADVRRAIWDEQQREAALMGPADETCMPRGLSRKANLRVQLPELPDWQEVSSHAATLAGMVDLGRTVVITGFSELGPHGNSRTRWEMEADGAYSLEGCVEMAWMMGLIKHDPHAQKNGSPWTGWVDAKTSEPVEDGEVPSKYMSFILQNTGLREIDPSTCDNNYDPERKTTVQDIELTQDLPPFEASLEVAQSFQLQHGSKAEINKADSGVYFVRLRAGAKILLPKATRFNRSTVAGQIPTGWSAKRYGIADEIIDQVDPVTLFTLVSTVDALLASGIVDPYELYQHIHISEVGNALGSSMGGLSSLRKVHRDRFLEKPVQGDILQETFTSTIGAWCNMLLMSSTGPIKTPVGACATSLESLDTGYDLLVSQNVKVCIVGGVEDFVEDVSFEFGSMQATCDTQKEFDAGRSPSEMSRPTASTRSGFVESQGCGVQILTTAELALELGLPIFGVVAYTGMAADGAGRSVPAPGQGVLGNARESTSGTFRPPLLDIGYRRRLLDMRLQQVNDNCQNNLDLLEHEIRYLKEMGTEGFEEERYRREVTATLEKAAKKQKAQLRFDLGNQFWKNEPDISPIRGSLATWGLGIDDIAVASLHGTSTIKNETNECSVLQSQLKHLGRTQGNLLHCVCQKSLTGHSKAAATAWVVNGACQMLSSGVVPGNRNADNIDDALRQHDLLHFPDTTLKMDAINAVEITSFGFGQKGGQAILVHPKFLYATIRGEAFEEYTTKRASRWRKACKAFSEGLLGENLVNLKTSPPYDKREEMRALLDPTARF